MIFSYLKKDQLVQLRDQLDITDKYILGIIDAFLDNANLSKQRVTVSIKDTITKFQEIKKQSAKLLKLINRIDEVTFGDFEILLSDGSVKYTLKEMIEMADQFSDHLDYLYGWGHHAQAFEALTDIWQDNLGKKVVLSIDSEFVKFVAICLHYNNTETARRALQRYFKNTP